MAKAQPLPGKDNQIGGFDRSVFVNCPFDLDYRSLFRPLIFTIHSLNFRPRFALERADSGETRLLKIAQLIQESRWAIHDLSRCVAVTSGEHYRMNMPLELGMDYGARTYGGKKLSAKRCLILEKERYRFQKTVSDLAGCDIKAHENIPANVVKIVHDWLVQEARAIAVSPTSIWKRFNIFMAAAFVELKRKGYSKRDIETLPENQLSEMMVAWLEQNPSPHS